MSLFEENILSELCINQDSGENLVDEEPVV
jgi:hypothetical protein